jgi:hypothetical protein
MKEEERERTEQEAVGFGPRATLRITHAAVNWRPIPLSSPEPLRCPQLRFERPNVDIERSGITLARPIRHTSYPPLDASRRRSGPVTLPTGTRTLFRLYFGLPHGSGGMKGQWS